MKQEKGVRVLRLVVLAVSLGCIVLGIIRGEHLTVLQKAIHICMQCIGIG